MVCTLVMTAVSIWKLSSSITTLRIRLLGWGCLVKVENGIECFLPVIDHTSAMETILVNEY